MTASGTGQQSVANRGLGVVGVLGGLVLLAAFVMDVPPAWNTARLLLFAAGAVAVAMAVHGRHAAAARPLALAGTVPVVLANAALIAWLLLAEGRERPFAGDFGLVGFWVGLAAWLADAWFGIVALSLGVVWRPAALVLAVGSVLAIAGMDRLGLTSAANPTVFGSIGLTGVALNGLAWVLLGLDIATGYRLRGWRRGLGQRAHAA
jgi:hypothetical protein